MNYSEAGSNVKRKQEGFLSGEIQMKKEGKRMADLKSRFEKASQEVQKLSKRPDNNTLLKLYAMFKQGSEGDVSGKRPGFTDFKGRAKYDAWAKLKGTQGKEAMKGYIQLVEKLKRM